jgi:hypothetical protein
MTDLEHLKVYQRHVVLKYSVIQNINIKVQVNRITNLKANTLTFLRGLNMTSLVH